MVQRFSMYVSAQAFGRCHMDEKDNGKFVLYEDYERLKEAVENYIDRMTHEFDSEYSLCSDPRIALAEILGRSLSDMQ